MVPSKAKAFTMRRAQRAVFNYRLRLTPAAKIRRKGRAERNPSLSVVVGTLADDRARLNAISAMIDATFAHRRRYMKVAKLGVPKPRHFLFTGCFDDGLIPGDIITEAQIERVINKTYRLIREMGLEGVFVLQIVGIQDTRNNSYDIWLHVHGLTMTADFEFRPVTIAKTFSQRRAYPNMLGAPSITLRSRKHSARTFRNKETDFYKFAFTSLRVDQTYASLSHLAYYLFHPPAFMLKLVPSAKDPAKRKLRSNKADYPAWLARRLHDLENQIPIEKAVFSVGDGKAIRSVWKRLYAALDRDQVG